MPNIAIVIGLYLPEKTLGGGHFGTKVYLKALSRYMPVRYYGIGQKDERYWVNENFCVKNLALSFFEEIMRSGVLGLFYILKIRRSVPLTLEVTYFFAKSIRKKIKRDINNIQNPVIIFDFPGGFLSMLNCFSGNPRILRAHNVEKFKFKADNSDLNIIENTVNDFFLELIEKKFVKTCDKIFVCTQVDAHALSSLYCIEKEKTIFIPPPVETEIISVPTKEIKEKTKKELGYEGKILCLFMGISGPSRITPNNIPKIIKEGIIPFLNECHKLNKNVSVVFIGKGCEYLKKIGSIPKNVHLQGYVEEPVKEKFLKAADIALNPMPSGAGINTRMIEYMAYGIPTVTTPIGARGFPKIESWKNSVIVEIHEFPDAINKLAVNSELREKIGIGGRKIIEEYFDAKVLGKKMYETIVELLKEYSK